jgi:hypothetical protein
MTNTGMWGQIDRDSYRNPAGSNGAEAKRGEFPEKESSDHRFPRARGAE